MEIHHDDIRWIKSPFCGSSACVEFAEIGEICAIRDSEDADGPVLTFDQSGWRAFIVGVRADAFMI